MGDHSKLSPSGAHRWMRCPGSVTLEAAYPDSSSAYAAEGTCAHDLAASVLTDAEFIIPVGETKVVDGYQIKVTQDMAEHVMDYCKLVWDFGGSLDVETRVDYSHVIGVPNSSGTCDAMIMRGNELIVIDLKFGMGVRVDAEENEQLQLYALGALEAVSLFSDEIDTVVMVIHQPRLNHVSEWVRSVADLQAFGERAKEAAHDVELAEERWGDTDTDWYFNFLTAGDTQCRFCNAKANCPALLEEVTGISSPATADDFVQFLPVVPDKLSAGDFLSLAMSKVDLVENWCKAVRAETERRLLLGEEIDGWKIVEGKLGNRAWNDAEAAEAMFKKSFRLRDCDVYEQKLISPTAAEKLLKGTPKRWKRLQSLISRAPGKPSVAPATDKRPALAANVTTAEDFAGFITEGH